MSVKKTSREGYSRSLVGDTSRKGLPTFLFASRICFLTSFLLPSAFLCVKNLPTSCSVRLHFCYKFLQ
ncbi:hypothetical protein IC582_001354 [Cucumis melo]